MLLFNNNTWGVGIDLIKNETKLIFMSKHVDKILLFITVSMFITLTYLAAKVSFLDDLSNTSNSNINTNTQPNPVYSEGDSQIIEITAKGGYFPGIVKATANKETILRVKTNSSFDCSTALVIPSLNVRKNLSPTATTDIPLGIQKPGTKIAGTCSMGMYNFSMEFN